MPTPEAIAAAVKSLAAAGQCGYALLYGQPCPVHDNGVPAQATITVKPQAADPELLTIEINSQGIPPADIAHALRQAAEQLDKEGRADEEQQATDPVAEAVGRVLAEWPEHNRIDEHQAVTQQVTEAARRALATEQQAQR